eukprot:6492799-Amphidinium_carterae.3
MLAAWLQLKSAIEWGSPVTLFVLKNVGTYKDSRHLPARAVVAAVCAMVAMPRSARTTNSSAQVQNKSNTFDPLNNITS